MSGDRQARVTLTGDAAGLNAAAQQAAKSLDTVSAAADKAAAHNAAASAASSAYSKATEAAGAAAAASASKLGAGAKAVDAVGVSAKQTAAAIRGLPAQLTDVATQLAGGANPMLVLLQQGGQVKDMFGGFGPMFRGVAAAITPTVAGVGALAVALGSAAAAYVAVRSETKAYEQAIVMTGNSAGVTVGQLRGMADAIAKAGGGSQGQAADALASLTASGAVSANVLSTVGEASVRMQRQMGASAEETTKIFAELAKRPGEASAELNRQYNYLDAATYKRIAALEKQKNQEAAAELAQKTFADAANSRLKLLESQLTGLDKLWNDAKVAARDAWAEFKGLFDDSPEAQLKKVRGELEKLRNGGYDKNPFVPTNGVLDKAAHSLYERFKLGDGLSPEERQRQQMVKAAQIGELERDQAAKEAAAKAAADAAAAEAKRIALAKEAAQHADAVRKARYQAEQQAIEQGTKLKTDALGNEQRLVDSQLQAGLISEAAAYQRRRELTQQETDAEVAGLQAKNVALKKQRVDYEAAVARDAEVAKNTSEMQRIKANGSAAIAVLNNQEAASLRALRLETKAYTEELINQLSARSKVTVREMAGAGMGDQARDRASRRSSIDDKYEDDLRRLNAERSSKQLPDNVYNERLNALQAYYSEALTLEADYQAQRAAVQGRADIGFERAWANWSENTRNVYSQVEAATTRAFDGMADSFANFAVTGKGHFTDFANSVMADILRIVIRAQMLKIFEDIFGKSGGAGGFFNMALATVKGWFGAGGSTMGGVNNSAGSTLVPGNVGHGGGVIGAEALYGVRMQPAHLWNGAPRYHSGLATDEFRAILKKNESILTPEQMKQLAPVGAVGGAAPININVINNTGTQANAQVRQRGDGGFDVILDAVEQRMADRVGAGQGPLTGALRGRFGLRDALV